MSDITIKIVSEKLACLLDQTDPWRAEIRKELVCVWLENGLFKPEKAKTGNLWVNFVDCRGALMDDVDVAIVAVSTIGSGLFVPGTTESQAFRDKFQIEAGDDIATNIFPGLGVDFWPQFTYGSYGSHRSK